MSEITSNRERLKESPVVVSDHFERRTKREAKTQGQLVLATTWPSLASSHYRDLSTNIFQFPPLREFGGPAQGLYSWQIKLQIQSFEAELPVSELASTEGGPETFREVFIHAPAIIEVGSEVQVLAEYPVPSYKASGSNSSLEYQEENVVEEKKVIVAVRQGNILATAFHPEFTADTWWHTYLLKMANDIGEEASASLAPVL